MFSSYPYFYKHFVNILLVLYENIVLRFYGERLLIENATNVQMGKAVRLIFLTSL